MTRSFDLRELTRDLTCSSRLIPEPFQSDNAQLARVHMHSQQDGSRQRTRASAQAKGQLMFRTGFCFFCYKLGFRPTSFQFP
jgi:hypothetical protein